MSHDYHWGYNAQISALLDLHRYGQLGLIPGLTSKQPCPHLWRWHFPAATGKKQSPVNIVTKNVVYAEDLKGTAGLHIEYKPEPQLQITNNGNSILAQMTKPSMISGGPLKQKYKLEQFHLHWGNCSNRGSEHTVNGAIYAAELHLVHYNCAKYADLAEAVDKEDGLAVFGIFIKVGAENKSFKVISDHVSNVKTSGKTFTIPSSFNPISLLPGNTSDYWTYPGSLTTPPCYESVSWIVFKEPVEYSEKQLSLLRSLEENDHGEKAVHIGDNYRPVQPIGDRKIRSSFPQTNEH